MRFLQTRTVSAGGGSRAPLFQKTLTLVGIALNDHGEPERTGGPQPEFSAIASIGLSAEALSSGQGFVRVAEVLDLSPNSLAADGKWDLFAAEPRAAVDLPTLLTRLQVARKSGRVDRSECHVIAVPIADLPHPSVEGASAGETMLPSCDCRAAVLALAQDARESAQHVLRGNLLHRVNATITLVVVAIGHKENCCDLRLTAIAVLGGLGRLLEAINEELADSTEVTRLPSWRRMEDLETIIRRWCVLVSRALRERTTGAFEGLLEAPQSVTGTRGSLQKLLFIADNLLHEFYLRVPSALRQNDSPTLSTLYEPIDTISSIRFTGLIRVPDSYAFSLHLVLPQLWHEVGQFVFQEAFSGPSSPETEEFFRRSNVPLDVDREELMAEAADVFSDHIVLYLGFDDDWPLFTTYLSSLVGETLRRQSRGRTPIPDEVVLDRFVRLVCRLHASFQFSNLIGRLANLNPQVVMSSMEYEASVLSGVEARQNVAGILQHVRAVFLQRDRYRDLGSRDLYARVEGHAVDFIRSPSYRFISEYGRLLAVQLLEAQSAPVDLGDDDVWRQLSDGYLVDLSPGQVAPYYLRMYKVELERQISRADEDAEERSGLATAQFHRAASLGRSAFLAYHSDWSN